MSLNRVIAIDWLLVVIDSRVAVLYLTVLLCCARSRTPALNAGCAIFELVWL